MFAGRSERHLVPILSRKDVTLVTVRFDSLLHLLKLVPNLLRKRLETLIP